VTLEPQLRLEIRFARTLDDPGATTELTALGSMGLPIRAEQERAAIIESTGEPDFAIGPSRLLPGAGRFRRPRHDARASGPRARKPGPAHALPRRGGASRAIGCWSESNWAGSTGTGSPGKCKWLAWSAMPPPSPTRVAWLCGVRAAGPLPPDRRAFLKDGKPRAIRFGFKAFDRRTGNPWA
jgi:hypothetical protein